MSVLPLRKEVTSTGRWLTFKEAAEALGDEHGMRTTARSLEKLAAGGRSGAMPSKINFGRRQVQLAAILPWLRERGIIER